MKPDLPPLPPLLRQIFVENCKIVCDYSTSPGRVRAARRAAWVTAAWARAATVPEACYPAAGCDVTRGPGLGLDESALSVSVTRDCRLASRGIVSRQLPLGSAPSRSPSSEPRRTNVASFLRACVNASVRVRVCFRLDESRINDVLPFFLIVELFNTGDEKWTTKKRHARPGTPQTGTLVPVIARPFIVESFSFLFLSLLSDRNFCQTQYFFQSCNL